MTASKRRRRVTVGLHSLQDTVRYGAARLTILRAMRYRSAKTSCVIDAFQKKSKSGIKTPQIDVDRIKQRLKRLKEMLRWPKAIWN
jgi:hypothetical protein